MPEHLDARTTISSDMFYCISAVENKDDYIGVDKIISRMPYFQMFINTKTQYYYALLILYIIIYLLIYIFCVCL